MAVLGVSERRACGVVGPPRATQRQRPQPRADEARLVARMRELVRPHPRFGYRRTRALLVVGGWRVGRKRVHRLWRANGPNVPRKVRKKRRLGSGENGCARRRAAGEDDVRCWDFIHDRTASGGPLKWLSVVDEYTRGCVALEVRRSPPASGVAAVPERLAMSRGMPGHIRSDNGPAFIAAAIRGWLSGAGVGTLYVGPGAPWGNGYAESFHGRLRDEFLGAEVFTSRLEARVLGAEWRRAYNQGRPHGSLGYKTPAEFAARCPRHAAAKPSPSRGHMSSG